MEVESFSIQRFNLGVVKCTITATKTTAPFAIAGPQGGNKATKTIGASGPQQTISNAMSKRMP
jgi:hypothetical protein